MTNVPSTIEAHDMYGLPLGFTPEGDVLVTGGFDGSLAAWRLPVGEQIATAEGHTQSVNSGAITATGNLVTGSTDRTLRLWEVPTLATNRVFSGHTKTVAGVAAHPSRQVVASGSYDGTVRVWPLDDEGDPTILRGHEGNVTSVAFPRDGQHIASGGIGDETLVWNADEAVPIERITGHGDAVVSVDTGPEGHLWTAGYNGRILRWDLAEQSAVDSFELPRERKPTGLAVSKVAERLAVTVEGGVLLLSTRGELIEEYSVAIKGVYLPRWSPDGEMLTVGGADGTIRIFQRFGDSD